MWFTLRPLPPDYQSPHRFVMVREVAIGADALFALLADVNEWPRWFPGMKRVTWISPEGQREQAHAVRRADTEPGDVFEHFVVWERPRRLAFYVEKMTSPYVNEFFEDYVIEPLGEKRARLTWTVAFAPRLVFRPLMFAIRPRFAKMFDDAADALVRYVAAR